MIGKRIALYKNPFDKNFRKAEPKKISILPAAAFQVISKFTINKRQSFRLQKSEPDYLP